MSAKPAACILALALFLVTFAVNLQAPLYDLYAGGGAMGATAVTLGFAAYVAGLMPTLVGLGGLSDRVGRRWPIALALLLGATATLLLIVAPGWPALVAARVMLGVGTGLATTSGAAYMDEILGADRGRLASQVVTASTSLGFGGGALATGLSLALQGADHDARELPCADRRGARPCAPCADAAAGRSATARVSAASAGLPAWQCCLWPRPRSRLVHHRG